MRSHSGEIAITITKLHQKIIALFGLWFNIPIKNFSVKLRQSGFESSGAIST